MSSEIVRLYVSCDEGQQIIHYAMDPGTGALDRIGATRLPVPPRLEPKPDLPMAHLRTSGAPLATSPDGSTLYAALRQGPARVVSYRIDSRTGALELSGEAPIPDQTPFVGTDRSGRFLFGACHPGNCVWIMKLDRGGAVVGPPGERVDGILQPHSVLLHPDNRFAYVAATGHEEILTFAFDEASGRLTRTGEPGSKALPWASPRHMALHHDNELLFCMNEASGIIDSFRIDPADGSLTLVESVDPRRPEARDAPGIGADLHLSPDGRFLYGSSRANSTISAYAVDAGTGAMAHVETVAAGAIPRSFAIEPSGRFLFAAGQGSDDITIFARDQASGRLSPAAVQKTGGGPIWVEIVA